MQLRVVAPLLRALKCQISCLLCLAILCHSASAQINKESLDDGTNLLSTFEKIDRNDPKAVEAFFAPCKRYVPIDTLGFGWVKVQKTKTGGYAHILVDFYYFKDSLYSYVLISYLPHDEEVAALYNPILQRLFPDKGLYACSFTHGKHFIGRPLIEFNSTGLKMDSSSAIQEYMSPESGIVYGETGGINGSELQNRKAFSSIAKHLTPSQVRQIMYSVNPASRLTAIEYYLKHKKRFTKQPEIDAWIGTVYRALPKVSTMHGCIGTRDNAKRLVEEFVKSE